MVRFHYDARPQALANFKFLYGPDTEILTTWSEKGFQTLVMSLDLNTDTWKCALQCENTYISLELATAAIHKLSASKVCERLSNRSIYECKPLWSEAEGGSIRNEHDNGSPKPSSDRLTLNNQEGSFIHTEHPDAHHGESVLMSGAEASSDDVDRILSVVEITDLHERYDDHDACVMTEAAIDGKGKENADTVTAEKLFRDAEVASFFERLVKTGTDRTLLPSEAASEQMTVTPTVDESLPEIELDPVPVLSTSNQDWGFRAKGDKKKNKKEHGRKNLISDSTLNEEAIPERFNSPATTMGWSTEEMRVGPVIEDFVAEGPAEEEAVAVAVAEEAVEKTTDLAPVEAPAETLSAEPTPVTPENEWLNWGAAASKSLSKKAKKRGKTAAVRATYYCSNEFTSEVVVEASAEAVIEEYVEAPIEAVVEAAVEEATLKFNDVPPTVNFIEDEIWTAKKSSNKSKKGKKIISVADENPCDPTVDEDVWGFVKPEKSKKRGGLFGWVKESLASKEVLEEPDKDPVIEEPVCQAPAEENFWTIKPKNGLPFGWTYESSAIEEYRAPRGILEEPALEPEVTPAEAPAPPEVMEETKRVEVDIRGGEEEVVTKKAASKMVKKKGKKNVKKVVDSPAPPPTPPSVELAELEPEKTPVEMPASPEVVEEAKPAEDDRWEWGGATITKNDKGKTNKVLYPTPPPPTPPAEPEPEPSPEIPRAILEEPTPKPEEKSVEASAPPEIMEETKSAEDDIWAGWGALLAKKHKKGRTKRVVDISPPPATPPLVEPEPEQAPELEKTPVEMPASPEVVEELKIIEDDTWKWCGAAITKNDKGKTKKVLDPTPPAMDLTQPETELASEEAACELFRPASATEDPESALKDLARSENSDVSDFRLAKSQAHKRYDVFLKIKYKNKTYHHLATLSENTRKGILERASAYLERIMQLDFYERNSTRRYVLDSAGGKDDLIDISGLAGGDWSDHLEFFVAQSNSVFPELNVRVWETGREMADD